MRDCANRLEHYPHLYNCSMKGYKDIYMGFNSWREIAQALAPLGQERYCNLAQSACTVYTYESNEVYFARLCVRLYALYTLAFTPRLGSCWALWSCTETEIWTFNPLIPIEVHYMEKNPGKFSSKTFISFQLKKERHEHFDWHRGE